MRVTIEITDEDVRGVIRRALGALSWGKLRAIGPSPVGLDSWVVDLVHEVDGRHVFGLDIARGLRMMLTDNGGETWVEHRNRYCEGSPKGLKAYTMRQCDAFVQYAAFGEIRYA